MGVFGASDQQEMLGPSDPMLSVAIQTHAEKTDDLSLVLFGLSGHRASSPLVIVHHGYMKLYAGARRRVNCKQELPGEIGK